MGKQITTTRRRHRHHPTVGFTLPPLPPPFAFAVTLAAACTCIESIYKKKDAATYKVPRGRMIAIRNDGTTKTMHVVYQGEESHPNSPCIVLEAGSNSWTAMWDDVTSELSSISRVLTYDRFGYGQSSSSFHETPQNTFLNNTIKHLCKNVFSHFSNKNNNEINRSPLNIANDLHHILSSSGAYPPYVFVAHSLGSLYINEAIRQLPPKDIYGIVYLDAASTSTVKLLKKIVPSFKPPPLLSKTLSTLGILRLLSPILLYPYWKSFPSNLRKEARATWSTADWLQSYMSEWVDAVKYSEHFDTSFKLDVPVAVLVPDIYEKTKGREFVAELQQRVRDVSNDSVVYSVADCGHFVQIDRPDVVVKAIVDVLDRGKESQKSRKQHRPALSQCVNSHTDHDHHSSTS